MAGSSTIQRHAIVIAGHKTSVSLEKIFWDALKQIAQERGLSLNKLISEIDKTRSGNLSSALRVFVLEHSLRTPSTNP